MATVWSPAPYIGKQEWLLQDGSIVTSPDFEATSSGRRVRIVGTQTSVGSRQAQDLVAASIDQIATERGTKRWMRIFDTDTEVAHRASTAGVMADVFKTKAVLHVNQDTQSAHGQTTLVWDFEAVGVPALAASVFIIFDQRSSRNTVFTKVCWRATNPVQNNEYPAHYLWDGSNLSLDTIYRYSDEQRVAEAAVVAAGGMLPGHEVEAKGFNNQFRQAIVHFAERAKAMDNVEEIELLDMTDPANPTMRKFKRRASNYSASLHNEILALVQTGPLVEQIKRSYTDLVNAMKQLGVVVHKQPGDNEFARAANGDFAALTTQIGAVDDMDANHQNGIDHAHTVNIDFTTGSVIVNCSHTTSGGLDEVAEAWNIAKFKAEVVGEKDILLAYAEAYKTPKEQARIKKIIEQRTMPEA